MANKEKSNLIEKIAISAILLIVGFKNVVFGCLLLPILVEKIGENSIGVSFTALGILVEAVLITYYILKINGCMD